MISDRPPPSLYSNQAGIDIDIPTAAYIHIPFCRRRCYYCDFPISVVGDRARGEDSGAIAQYVEILCQEITTTPNLGQPLETVFFGGGTPSLLSVAQLEHILDGLNHHFGMTATAEISIEMDPGTFDLPHIRGYRTAGVNRVSLGVQAFQSELLAACGRTHTATDINIAVDLIHHVNLLNFSLDLISGLPHQTLEHWQTSLHTAIDLAPSHLSIYDLTIEPMTAFGRWYRPGEQPLPSEEMTAHLYRIAQQTLTIAGYDHYEISNYAKPGYQCRHNRVYWENRSYYGFGMGAASYVQGQRFTRPRKRREYFQWVQDLVNAEGKIECPITSATEMLLDTLMLGLRLAEGVNLSMLGDRFGKQTLHQVLTCLYPYYQKRWVEILDYNTQPIPYPNGELNSIPDEGPIGNARIRLTDPEGFLFSNVMLTSLFEKLEH
jgi:putative oxygen-independent coproporphyrinogen III oxidase